MPRSISFPARYAPALCAFLFFVFGLLAALAAPAGSAPRPMEAPRPVEEGLVLHPPGVPGVRIKAPVVAGTAEIVVNGITGRATVQQTFLNPEDAWVEGIYVFPLPEDAAVDRLRLRVDGRRIEGVVAERAAARERYAEAAAGGQRASLLEQDRPNLFTMSVANIPPNSRIEVEIGYQQAVTHQDGRYSIRFPMAVTPRYMPAPAKFRGVRQGGLDDLPAQEKPPRFPVRGPDAPETNPMAIRVRLDPGLPLGDLKSPSHALMVAEQDAGTYDITLKAGVVATDRDFVLEWTLQAPPVPAPMLFVEEVDGAAYLLAMIVPPQSHRPDAAAPPREAVFVIDTSGSMHGTSMRQARDALLFALGRLGARDRVNIVAFSDRPRRLFAESREADAASLDAARSFVAALDADGGTEIGLALEQALEGPAEDGRLRQVILLTDGAVGNEAALLSRLRRSIGESRLFTVAIGSAPNGYFMREAARIGRGAMLHISDMSQVGRQVSALFAKLERPALTDIAALFPLPEATVALPSPVPDLYVGEPLVLTARLPKATGPLVLTGRAGTGRWRGDAALDAARPGTGIAKLWARARVDREMGRLRSGADAAAVRLAVLDLALRHGLLTDYTSLVAVDEVAARPADEAMAARPVPVNPPAGWTPPDAGPHGKAGLNRAAAGALSPHSASAAVPTVTLGVPTATPAATMGILGLLALLAAGLLWAFRRRLAA